MDFDEKLINAVQRREAIYDIRNMNYRNNILRMQMWHDVANELNINVDICQKRWKSLRRKFSEEWQRKKTPSGSATSSKKKPWIYFEMLLFLKPFVDSRDTVTSVCDQTEVPQVFAEESEIFDNSQNTTLLSPSFSEDETFLHLDTPQQAEPRPGPSQPTSTPTRPPSSQSTSSRGSGFAQKRKRVESLIEKELNAPETDEVQNFLLSMAPLLRSLDPVARLEAQIDIQNVILKKIKEMPAKQ